LWAFLHGKGGVAPIPLGLPQNIERRNAEPLIFTFEGAEDFSLVMSKKSQPSMTTGATALSPQDEPAIIKIFQSKSKGFKKY
jgi:hypothetical protein